MLMIRRSLSSLVVIVAVAAPALAQSGLPIAVDQRVRLWTDAADAVTGRVIGVTPTTVQVAPQGRDAVTVATSSVRRIEIGQGRTSRGAGLRKGAIRGAIIMGVLGALSLGLQHGDIGEDGATVTEAVLLGVWSGGLFGGLIGGAIGAARSGDRWEQVWP
jgi:hypothetical protein